MAAVLAHFLPERYLRQSLNSRVPEADMGFKRDIATTEANPSLKLNGNMENGVEQADKVQGDDDAFQGGEHEQDNEEDEDEYHDPDDVIQAHRPKASRLRNRRQKVAQNRNSIEKAPRRGVADSEEDGSSEAGDSSSEEAEPEWEAESDAAEVEEQHGRDGNRCIYCEGDENEDPSEDFEEMLACSSCEDKSHRQCAREANSLDSDDSAVDWRCQNCIENGIEPETQAPVHQRRSSAPKIARDLLPPQRGASRPGSHSVFSTLILEGDPMDGSRSLRKRKASSEVGDRPLEVRKRSRRGTSEVIREEPLSLDGATSPPRREPSLPALPDSASFTSPPARTSRTRGTRRPDKALVTIVEPCTEDNLTLAFHLGSEKLAGLANETRRRKRRDRERVRRAQASAEIPVPEMSHYPALQSSSFAFQAVYSDREGDEVKHKPYGGILTEAEADTTRTFPQAIDRKKFEDARLKAEEDWKRKIEAAREAEAGRSSQKTSGPPSKIKCINFAGYEIDTWHAAPYPEEYSRNRVLYICEFCLKYMNSDFVAWRHKLKCPAKHPPGDEIYRDEQFSFFEVDGRKNPVYCQNLCLLAKLFLGSKTLYYDVEPFLFYIMTENNGYGCHFVGYFSKEKRPSSLNNVSCILVLPIHQRRGFGNLLIEFSYLLTRVEEKTGSPEKPLSDMGLVTYRSYWRLIMCYQLVDQKGSISIAKLSERTGMTADDIVCALEGLRALVRDPITKTYALRLDYEYFRQYITNYEAKGYVKLNPDALMWVPYVMGRDNMHYENAAPLYTVAQRDDEADEPSQPEEGVQNVAAAGNEDGTSKAASSDFVTTPQPASPDPQNTADPYLSLPQESSTNGLQDAEQSDSQPQIPGPATGIIPTTPFITNPNPTDSDFNSPIPATRFEVFPPLPGTSARRRAGRTSGRTSGRTPASGRSARRTTSVRRNLSFGDTPGAAGSAKPPPATVRRTRSKLADEVRGDDEGEDELGLSPVVGKGKVVVPVVEGKGDELAVEDELAE